MVHSYEVGTRAWQPDTAEGWVGSEVVDRKVDGDKVTLVFNLDNGEVSRSLILREIRFPGEVLECAG